MTSTAEMVDWISAAEAAVLIGVSTKTLGRWRNHKDPKTGKPYGPKAKKNPGGSSAHVQYRKSTVLKWIDDQEK